MGLSRKSMETAIVFDGTSAPALVVTSDPKVQRKLQILAKKDPTIVFKTSDNISQTWNVPKDLIYFRKRRKLTEERKQAQIEALTKYREEQNEREQI